MDQIGFSWHASSKFAKGNNVIQIYFSEGFHYKFPMFVIIENRKICKWVYKNV